MQVIGPNLEANRAYADKLLAKINQVTGIADARIQQAFNAPTFNVDVDRTRAELVGVSERDVAQNLQDALAGSIQSAPTFWLNPKNGVSYPIVAQTPQYWENSLSSLANIPASLGPDKQILGGVAAIKRGVSDAVVSHYAVRPVVDIFATNNERDLGAVSADIQAILDAHGQGRAEGFNCRLARGDADDDVRIRPALYRHRLGDRAHLSADRR